MAIKLVLPYKVDGTYYKPNLQRGRQNVSSLEMMIPTFKSSNLAHLNRDVKFPSILFRMITVGASGSGKSELIQKIYNKQTGFNTDYDAFVWYGEKDKYPINPNTFPPHEPGKPTIVAFDDPDLRLHGKMIAETFRRGRPLGISSIVTIHNYGQLISNAHLNVAKEQANIFCFCRAAALGVLKRPTFFDCLACPDIEKRYAILASLDGNMDYNWVTMGPECFNYKLGYFNAINTFKEEKIDTLLPRKRPLDSREQIDTESSSSYDTSSDDDDDDAEVQEDYLNSREFEPLKVFEEKYEVPNQSKKKPERPPQIAYEMIKKIFLNNTNMWLQFYI